jgi:metal-sulfur cluster biosynthetic enzyme
VQRKVQALQNVTSVKVDVTFDPPWTTDRMSEAAKLQLGIDD